MSPVRTKLKKQRGKKILQGDLVMISKQVEGSFRKEGICSSFVLENELKF